MKSDFKPPEYTMQSIKKKQGSNIQIGMEGVPHAYASLAKESYKEIPKDFVKAKPLKQKNELLKTNYSVSYRNFFTIFLYSLVIIKLNTGRSL